MGLRETEAGRECSRGRNSVGERYPDIAVSGYQSVSGLAVLLTKRLGAHVMLCGTFPYDSSGFGRIERDVAVSAMDV